MLSQAVMLALYRSPDFDEFQRAEYFALADAGRAPGERRKGPPEQLHRMVLIGFFKTKNALFALHPRRRNTFWCAGNCRGGFRNQLVAT